MQLTSSIVSLGFLASAASAIALEGFEFPDFVPMHKRQTEGPSYECHANCGFTIRNARQEGYCEDEEWLSLLDGCLDCALEFDIWEDYGGSVSRAAEACGLDSEPRPVGGGGGGETSAAPEPSTEAPSSTPVEETSAPAEPTTAEVTSSAPVEETSAPSSTAAAETTAAPDVTSSSSAVTTPTSAPDLTSSALTNEATTTPTTVPESGAAKNWIAPIMVAGAALGVALNLM